MVTFVDRTGYRRIVPPGWTVLLAALAMASWSGCQRTQKPTSKPAADKPAARADQTAEPVAQGTAEPSARPADAAAKPSDSAAKPAAQPDAQAAPAADGDLGKRLFVQHCSACHGEQGDGQGLAARFLFPKPRDFRFGRFRLVSTANGVPSAADLEGVLQRGMPGSAMPPWPKLSDAERKAVVGEVQRLWRAGLLAQLVATAKDNDEELDPQEAESIVKSKTTAGEKVAAPDATKADEAAVARGKDVYFKQNCNKCHGETGKGDGAEKQVDSEGLATRPRDFTRGIFKGGHDAASVYHRIALGMPGTPMPSSAGTLQPQQMADLAQFVLSLSNPAAREAALVKRQRIVAAKVAALPQSADDAAWSAAPETGLRVTPLWWRDDAEPALIVQALHDGKSLAFRLRWTDATHDDSATGPDQFEDMAAIELVAGPQEPFLGMGAEGMTVDLWQWRGGAENQAARDALAMLDDYPFDTPEYKRLTNGVKLPDFLTARAAGNPLAGNVPSGAALGAKGPGSVTFLPKASPSVAAQGTWTQGRWAVVLERPLAVAQGEGLPLAAGSTASVGFALWDGAARDRGPQKLVSIWNDLELAR